MKPSVCVAALLVFSLVCSCFHVCKACRAPTDTSWTGKHERRVGLGTEFEAGDEKEESRHTRGCGIKIA
ncbi:hypothetical protein V6N11_063506 [Hibiscus sabdariffa]|uniref:Secreted protein n=1 Tax=Hibiscus sabdariffa TaxID=183260 RepID=A0ABR1ZMY1_9ROSI